MGWHSRRTRRKNALVGVCYLAGFRDISTLLFASAVSIILLPRGHGPEHFTGPREALKKYA